VFAAAMERQYRDDLMRATEIVLQRRRRSLRPVPTQVDKTRPRRAPSGSAGRIAASAVRVGSAVGTAITRPRALLHQDGRIMGGSAAVLIILAAIGIAWPRAVAWPLAAIALWFAISFLIRAWRGRRDVRRSKSSR
jgi:cardiolipin synthase